MWTGLCWTLFVLVVRGSAEPAPPHNLTMVALNTNYELHWAWDGPDPDRVTFAVQYLSSYIVKPGYPEEQKWNSPASCGNTSRRFCDLTHQSLLYQGSYHIRVRACVGGVPSDWSSVKFCPDDDAPLGPPSRVELSAVGAELEVILTDPLTSSHTSMRKEVSSLSYHILYWEHQGDPQSRRTLRSPNNRVVLSDLRPWTTYCVAVQSLAWSYINKSSSFTPTQCSSTGGSLPWWQVFLVFLVSLLTFLLLLPLVLLLYRGWRTIRSTCFPPVLLPDSLAKLLSHPPGSDRPLLLYPAPSHELSVSPVLVVQALPEPAPGLEPPSGEEPHGAGGSGDSGVYSLDYSGSSTEAWRDQARPKSLMEGCGTALVGVAD